MGCISSDAATFLSLYVSLFHSNFLYTHLSIEPNKGAEKKKLQNCKVTPRLKGLKDSKKIEKIPSLFPCLHIHICHCPHLYHPTFFFSFSPLTSSFFSLLSTHFFFFPLVFFCFSFFFSYPSSPPFSLFFQTFLSMF